MRLGFGFDSPSPQSRKKGEESSPSAQGHDEFGYASLAPPGVNEVEFFIDSPLGYKPRESVRSNRKSVGCFSFDILVFPAGNQTSFVSTPKVAVYVEAADVGEKDSRWIYNSVKFSICIINFKDVRKSLFHDDSHSFCASAVDRGWPELLSHSDMTQDEGWLDSKGRMCLRASVCVRQADTIQMGSDFDTRKETGFIGLKNHGATCYLNGLLQSYFHIGKFREVVYHMQSPVHSPTSGTRMSLPLALQSVFLKLESSDVAVNTLELTKAFGWDSMDAFTQHDVQELARILCDKLEEKLKNTPGDGAIQNLFEGQVENYIECIDIEYKSTKKESFYDIPLNVRGLAGDPLGSLESALREFTAVEVMEGDNAYDAESHGGKQRARKGIRFTKFPPVLSFQLKRFSFDYEKMDNVKVNDQFEFPSSLNLDAFCPGSGDYDLHTVLVHAGDVHSGHYYAFIRPKSGSDWFRFDDEQVSRCSEFAAVDDNFGGEDCFPYNYYSRKSTQSPPTRRPRIHSAYMLVYIKRAQARELLLRPSISEVQERVLVESRQIDERKRLQDEEKSLIDISLVVAEDLRLGRDGRMLNRVRKDIRVSDLVSRLVSEEIVPGPSSNVALFYLYSSSSKPRWTLMSRIHTSASTTPKSSRLSPSAMRAAAVKFPPLSDVDDRRLDEFVLPDSGTFNLLAICSQVDPLQNWTDKSPFLLIIVKNFNIETRRTEISHVGYVHMDDRISSLVPSVDEFLGFEEDSLRQLELGASFSAEHIVSGTVIVLQRNTIIDADTEESSEDELTTIPQLMPPSFTVRTFADHVIAQRSSVDVQVALMDARKPNSSEPLEIQTCKMDKRWNLRVVVSALMKAFNLVVKNKRVEIYNKNPLVFPGGPIATSADLNRIGFVGKLSNVLELFLVVIPNHSLCIKFFDDNVQEEYREFIDVLSLPLSGRSVTASDIATIIGKEGEFRLVEHFKSKISRLYGSQESVDFQVALANVCNPLYEYVRIERGPAQPPEGQVCAFVSHVDKSSGVHFGNPFVLFLDPTVTAKQLRHLIQNKLAVDDKAASRWRLCVDIMGTTQRLIKDDDLVVGVAKSHGAVSDHLNIVLEQSHPTPELIGIHSKAGGGSHAYKPLTIR